MWLAPKAQHSSASLGQRPSDSNRRVKSAESAFQSGGSSTSLDVIGLIGS
jgi:hypothetical protein